MAKQETYKNRDDKRARHDGDDQICIASHQFADEIVAVGRIKATVPQALSILRPFCRCNRDAREAP
jgi:hypothetical protein